MKLFNTDILVLLLGASAVAVTVAQLQAREAHPIAGIGHLSNVHARSCAVRDHGCEKGYCWTKCKGDGSWCWLALGRGHGSWLTCLNDEECGPDPWGMRDAACGICDGSACGCSC